MNDGYGDADEVSFATTTTTPDFLGSLSSRDQRNNPFHEQAPETEENEKKQSTKENEWIDKTAETSLHESSVSPPSRWENHIKSYPGHDPRAFHKHNRGKPDLYSQ